MYSYAKKGFRDAIINVKHAVFDSSVLYLYNKLFTQRDSWFVCGGRSYDYVRFSKNLVYQSERVIEIPVVLDEVMMCRGKGGKILELGNVLSYHYDWIDHDIIDKYEIAPNVINQDIMDYTPESLYDLIVSISTVEHIGYDEPDMDPFKCVNALKKLFKLTKPDGKVIITVPLGWNPTLDDFIRRGDIGFSTAHLMHRITYNNWREESLKLLKSENFEYNHPYRYANWVMIMTFGGQNEHFGGQNEYA